MKIDASTVMMSSSRQAVRRQEIIQTTVRETISGPGEGEPPVSAPRATPKDRLSLSAENAVPSNKVIPPNVHSRHTRVEAKSQTVKEKKEYLHSAALQSLKTLIEKMFGKRIELVEIGDKVQTDEPEPIESDARECGTTPQINDETVTPAEPAGTPRVRAEVNERVRQVRQEWLADVECTRYGAKGHVQTKDGRRIEIDLSVTMNREFQVKRRAVLSDEEVRKTIDPLVINLDVASVSLTQSMFSFDLDADGTQEQLASLTQGSAYLALDRNGDHVINNGSELFGATSGDGFAELAQFDEDGNGFIDEGDSVFAELQLWIKDASGEDKLIGLAQANIGAISLQATQTEFSINTVEDNTQLGQLRSSSFYINEDGSTGTIQQIDYLA